MHLDGDDEKDEKKSPAWASRKYPTLFMFLDLIPQAYAWPIIVYRKKGYFTATWRMQDICGKFIWQLWTYLFLIFSKTKARGQDQCDSEAVCDTQQPQNVTTHQILDFYLT